MPVRETEGSALSSWSLPCTGDRIYGTATQPRKMRYYRAAARVMATALDNGVVHAQDPAVQEFQRLMVKVGQLRVHHIMHWRAVMDGVVGRFQSTPGAEMDLVRAPTPTLSSTTLPTRAVSQVLIISILSTRTWTRRTTSTLPSLRLTRCLPSSSRWDPAKETFKETGGDWVV